MVDFVEPSRGAEAREERLHRFVRQRRMRLAPESHFLGEHRRLSARIGKPVTQEEIAEHLGISRQWYARFEGGAPAEFSPPLLGRLCDLLLLSPTERAELMRLAMPELAPVVSQDASALYNAMQDVRQTVKRLWTASSEAEIFQFAGEEARRMVPHSDLIWVQRDSLFARDEALFPLAGVNSAARLTEARTDALHRFTPEHLKRLDALLQRTPAGTILPFEAYPPDIVRLIDLALREHRLSGESLSLVAARIHGSSGFGGAVVSSSTRAQDMTEVERAVLSAIADFASLALR
jgi:transcriptional regulator with XRE-family HTH domain